MAVRLGGLGLSMIALGIVMLPTLRRKPEPEPSESQRRVFRLGQLRGQGSVARLYWTALAERDSGLALVERTPRSPTPSVVLRGFSPRAHALRARRIIDSLWQQLDRVDTSVRVSLVIYNGARYGEAQQRWQSYSGTSIVSRPGGVGCVALVPSGEAADGAIAVGSAGWEGGRLIHALAPCLLLARFGAPGSGVGAWLTATRYEAAGSSAWLDQPRGFIDGYRHAPWATWRQEDRAEGRTQESILLGSAARWAGQTLGPPYQLGGQGLRCLTGDAASCHAAVLDPSARIAAETKALPGDLTYSESMVRNAEGFALLDPRLPGNWWLSDLIRDQGPEKFASFWKSDQALDAAFQSAFGETLGAWTQRWSVRQWENSYQQMYNPQPLLLGATLAPEWPLLALAWTGVALLLTTLAARNRQVR
jgi:hypothetical protein